MSNEENQILREREEEIIEITFFNDNEKNQIINGKEISIILFEQSQLLLLYLLHFPILLFVILLIIYNLPKNYFKTRLLILFYSFFITIIALFKKCIVFFKYEKDSQKIIIRLNNLLAEFFPKMKFRTKTFDLEINEETNFIIEKAEIGENMINFCLYYENNMDEICIFNVIMTKQLQNECLKLKHYFEIIKSLNDKKIQNN